ncbi:hypothetical protein EYF80_060881 [Liparis tanakae]|uniref:Uncharacterized protein n=1 Tax=Liparis tanakae TaxID=230148 RepID=A0A4Z2EJH7_9TELE|nr:hypothetical protein EYF80_060881 [Liparis tanakae]
MQLDEEMMDTSREQLVCRSSTWLTTRRRPLMERTTASQPTAVKRDTHLYNDMERRGEEDAPRCMRRPGPGGGMEGWRSGGVEEWRSGVMEGWRSGGVEEWRS